ncbi:hypothetical protein BHE74_00051624 [Ensete ventricosum]|nr:hypothetical protein BHE74_00051624 [Ensete ventricosum]
MIRSMRLVVPDAPRKLALFSDDTIIGSTDLQRGVPGHRGSSRRFRRRRRSPPRLAFSSSSRLSCSDDNLLRLWYQPSLHLLTTLKHLIKEQQAVGNEIAKRHVESNLEEAEGVRADEVIRLAPETAAETRGHRLPLRQVQDKAMCPVMTTRVVFLWETTSIVYDTIKRTSVSNLLCPVAQIIILNLRLI